MNAVRLGKWVAYHTGGGQTAKSQAMKSPAPAAMTRSTRRTIRTADQGVPMMLIRKEPRWSALSDCPTAGTVTVT